MLAALDQVLNHSHTLKQPESRQLSQLKSGARWVSGNTYMYCIQLLHYEKLLLKNQNPAIARVQQVSFKLNNPGNFKLACQLQSCHLTLGLWCSGNVLGCDPPATVKITPSASKRKGSAGPSRTVT